MPFYETVFIVRQDVSAKQVEHLAADLAKIIEDNGGTVAKTEHWGLRPLAYKIKKNRKGHYVLFAIDAPAAAVQEMERRARLNEDIIRLLTVRTETLATAPSVMAKGRERRSRRDRGERRAS